MSAASCCGGAPPGAPFSFGLAGTPAYTRNNPFIMLPVGQGALVAGPGPGVAFGRFGFADLVAGTVSSARTDPAQSQCVPLFEHGSWQKVYYDDATNAWWLRPGLAVTCLIRGDVWMAFAGGAVVGQPVYASPVDGQAYSGNTLGCERTRFTVGSNTGPGGVALITSRGTILS